MQVDSFRAGKKASSIGNSLTIKTKKEMKKNLFMVAAVALMALVSCNKEEINNGVQEPASDIVFVAEFEQEADTKIALGEKVDGVRKTTWVAGDQIKINGTVFSAQADGASTAFKTTAAFDETAKTFRAVYPASSYISTTAVDIPASQNGTFAGASIAVAESSTTSLTFQNLVTILKFQVPVNCSIVTFESTASIAGRITVNYNDGVITPDYAGVTQPNKTINVTGTFVPGTDYYVAVKPDTHTFTVKIDGNVSKESTKAVTVERSKILNMGVLPEPVVAEPVYHNVYVCISDLGWSSVNMHQFTSAGDITSWPGEALTETVTVAGRTYYKKAIEEGTTLSFTYNNGKTSSNFKIDVPNVTVKGDIYYRLSARGAIEVDPNDVKTFGYAIYVFDQKSKNVAPNLYAWNDNNAWKTQYGGNFSSWPGVAFNNDCYYVPADGNNWKHYYYYEIPTALYGKSFMFIVNKKGQTDDLSVTNLSGDLYVGYWYDSDSSNGFWANSNLNTPITQ